MASYFIFALIQAILLQTVYSQCVSRVVPNCAQNALPIETFLPLEAIGLNQVFFSQLPLAIPALPNFAPYPQILPSTPEVIVPGVPGVAYAPTVIEDSTVANNLANTLQLLVVSSLLSNTLPSCDPFFRDPYVPFGAIGPLGPIKPIGPYNYVY